MLDPLATAKAFAEQDKIIAELREKNAALESELAEARASLRITSAHFTDVLRRAEKAEQKLEAQKISQDGCTGHLVHDEFTRCPVHDR